MGHVSFYPRPMIELFNAWTRADAPAWIAALGGLGALIVASIAAWKTHGLFKIESGRDKAAQERDDRAQADLVAAWLDVRTMTESTRSRRWHIVIVNGNKVPIYSLRVAIIAGFNKPTELSGAKMIERFFPVLQPGEELSYVKEGLIGVIESSLTTGQVAEFRERLHAGGHAVIEACAVCITFRDASGLHWTRTNEGKLYRGLQGPFEVEKTVASEEELK